MCLGIPTKETALSLPRQLITGDVVDYRFIVFSSQISPHL